MSIDTPWPHFGVDYLRGGRVWGPAMYALESVTLGTFAVFLVWAVKILIS